MVESETPAHTSPRPRHRPRLPPSPPPPTPAPVPAIAHAFTSAFPPARPLPRLCRHHNTLLEAHDARYYHLHRLIATTQHAAILMPDLNE